MQSNKQIQKSVITIDDFLMVFDGDSSMDFQKILNLDFKFDRNRQNQKLDLIIQIAEEEDAEEITQIFKDVYKGTYPYKQMEDVEEIRKMITDSTYKWFLFKLDPYQTVGCFGANFKFEKKKGLLFGFIIKNEYQDIIDSLKAFIACLIYILKAYRNKILVWVGEIRTNDTTPQYATSLCGLKPIAFFPNKDIFLNRVESIFLHVIYDEKALERFRSKKKPEIIRQVLPCFSYSNNRYHLGLPKVKNPKVTLNSIKISKLRSKTIRKIEETKKNNKVITFSIRNSESYFKFLYNPFIRTIEKTEYEVNNLEELFIYIEELKSLMQKLSIRYFQCFVSSYEPKHQKLFFNTGFKPMGYVFSWEYKKDRKKFEDCIVFCYYEDNLNKNMKLIPESLELIKFLNIS